MQRVQAQITDTKPAPESPAGSVVMTVVVQDPERPDIEGVFEYLGAPNTVLHPLAIAVRPRSGLPLHKAGRVSPSMLRDLPLTRWDSAARGQIGLQAMALEGGPSPITDPWKGSQRIAELIVKSRYPDLDPSASAAQKRRWESLTHLAQVSTDMMSLQVFGEKDPTAAIAEHYDVKPATVRSWLHRARQAGVSALEEATDA